jgi:glycosyltransferase involved in cell wall biosynthesis
MLILHLITSLQCGGAENQLEQLILHSNRHRVRHIVISIKEGGQVWAELEGAGVKVYSLGLKGRFPSPFGLVRLVRLIRRFSPDVLHCWLYHGCLLGALGAPFAGVRKMIWGLRSANAGLQGYSLVTRTVVRLCSRLSSRASVILVNSESSRAIHASWGYRTSDMRVVSNGVDARRFCPDPVARQSVREELGLPRDSILVGLFARHSPMKNHPNFLRAGSIVHRRYPNVHFVLAGKDIGSNNQRLVQLVHENKLQGVTCLLGERSDMPRLTAALDVACLSSSSESFGNVVVEAMACEVPCVVTNVGDLASIVGNAGKAVPPSDPLALAEAIMALIAMPPQARAALGQQGRERVLTHFTIQRTVNAYETIYEQCVWGPAGGVQHATIVTSTPQATSSEDR